MGNNKRKIQVSWFYDFFKVKSLLEEKQRMALEVKSGSSSSGSSTSSSTSSSSTSSSSSSRSSEDEIDDNLTEETKSQLLQAKHQYRELKMKLLQSIKENEVLTDELRRHQRRQYKTRQANTRQDK